MSGRYWKHLLKPDHHKAIDLQAVRTFALKKIIVF